MTKQTTVDVECPTCGATPGHGCRTPKGRLAMNSHPKRTAPARTLPRVLTAPVPTTFTAAKGDAYLAYDYRYRAVREGDAELEKAAAECLERIAKRWPDLRAYANLPII